MAKYACHVFVSVESTQHIAEACGYVARIEACHSSHTTRSDFRRAFNRFYQKFMESAYPVEDIYLE